MEWKDLVPILISVFTIIIGFIIQYFTIISKLTERISQVELKAELFWKIVEQEIPKILHSPHTPEIDELLEKMMINKLTITDVYKLKCMLKEELETPQDKTRVLSIVLLMARLEQYDKKMCVK
jgi:hypothetical protein